MGPWLKEIEDCGHRVLPLQVLSPMKSLIFLSAHPLFYLRRLVCLCKYDMGGEPCIKLFAYAIIP